MHAIGDRLIEEFGRYVAKVVGGRRYGRLPQQGGRVQQVLVGRDDALCDMLDPYGSPCSPGAPERGVLSLGLEQSHQRIALLADPTDLPPEFLKRRLVADVASGPAAEP